MKVRLPCAHHTPCTRRAEQPDNKRTKARLHHAHHRRERHRHWLLPHLPGTNHATAPPRSAPLRFALPRSALLCPVRQKKYTLRSRFWHKNRGIPQREPDRKLAAGAVKPVTWPFQFWKPNNLRRIPNKRALFAGYLGFCARISSFRCTFSTLNARYSQPGPPGRSDPWIPGGLLDRGTSCGIPRFSCQNSPSDAHFSEKPASRVWHSPPPYRAIRAIVNRMNLLAAARTIRSPCSETRRPSTAKARKRHAMMKGLACSDDV